MAVDPAPGAPTLAAKLDRLWATRLVDGRTLTYPAAAAAMSTASGTTVSASALWNLRTGRTTNPTIATVAAIAHFFRVPVSYLVDDDADTELTDAELQLAVAMRAAGVRELALRAAELTPASLRAIAGMVDTVRRIESGGGPDTAGPEITAVPEITAGPGATGLDTGTVRGPDSSA